MVAKSGFHKHDRVLVLVPPGHKAIQPVLEVLIFIPLKPFLNVDIGFLNFYFYGDRTSTAGVIHVLPSVDIKLKRKEFNSLLEELKYFSQR